MSRSRAWCFTLNNYGELPELAGNMSYLVYGKEFGESGTPHLQGYVYFKNANALSACRKFLDRAHWEVSKGTPSQAIDYCKKDGDFVELGSPPISQKDKGRLEKDRWARILSLSEAGDWESLKEEFPQEYCTQLKKLEHVHNKRKRELDVLNGEMLHEWIVGPTGCGKSRSARVANPDAYVKNPNVKWWDGYDGQNCVIIDDFDKYQVSQGGDMKRWLDRYPFQAEMKGTQELIRPIKIVVTSQYYPHEIWDDQKTVDAINRRIKLVELEKPLYPLFVNNFNPKN